MSAPGKFLLTPMMQTISDEEMRSAILIACRACFANGYWPSMHALRRFGVRGDPSRITQMRDAMCDEGVIVIPDTIRQRGDTGRHRRQPAPAKPKAPPERRFTGDPECCRCRREFWKTWLGGLTREVLRREGGAR